MTDMELRKRIIDKTAEMLEKVTEYDELIKIAEVYNAVTKEECARLLYNIYNQNNKVDTEGHYGLEWEPNPNQTNEEN